MFKLQKNFPGSFVVNCGSLDGNWTIWISEKEARYFILQFAWLHLFSAQNGIGMPTYPFSREG